MSQDNEEPVSLLADGQMRKQALVIQPVQNETAGAQRIKATPGITG